MYDVFSQSPKGSRKKKVAISMFGVPIGPSKQSLNFGYTTHFKNDKIPERDSRRKFSREQETELWDRQIGKCDICKKPLKRSHTHYDHIKPWADGGKTVIKNGRALCANCHSDVTRKTNLKKVNKKRKKKPSNSMLGFGNNYPRFF